MLRTALAAERHFPHYDGPRGDPERIRFACALVADIQRLVEAGEHVAPSPWTVGGIRDKVMNAYDRLLVGYAAWGGWCYYGWDGYENPSTYLGPAIWSERDCDFRCAYELEREWPGAVHMEFPIAKWTRTDFAPPEVVQRVDVSVSEFSGFEAGGDASTRFKDYRHEAFFELKWCTKGWSQNSRELKLRRRSIPQDVLKLGNHIQKKRCLVAGMVVFDDEGWFHQQDLNLSHGWPTGVWRMDVGPHALRWRGLISHAEYEEAVKRHT